MGGYSTELKLDVDDDIDKTLHIKVKLLWTLWLSNYIFWISMQNYFFFYIFSSMFYFLTEESTKVNVKVQMATLNSNRIICFVGIPRRSISFLWGYYTIDI